MAPSGHLGQFGPKMVRINKKRLKRKILPIFIKKQQKNWQILLRFSLTQYGAARAIGAKWPSFGANGLKIQCTPVITTPAITTFRHIRHVFPGPFRFPISCHAFYSGYNDSGYNDIPPHPTCFSWSPWVFFFYIYSGYNDIFLSSSKRNHL